MLHVRGAQRCAELADDLRELWQRDDAGIWEVEPRPYTQSKTACWAGLDHAIDLAEHGRVPGDSMKRWRRERDAIRAWVDEHCWSEQLGAYVLHPGSDELDAAILLAARSGFCDPDGERFTSTLEAIRSRLGRGPFLYRTTGLVGQEGCFLACSFWLVDALARGGRTGEARELMDELLAAANDVGSTPSRSIPRRVRSWATSRRRSRTSRSSWRRCR